MNPNTRDITPSEIIKGLEFNNRLLTSKNEDYGRLAEAKAQAEKDYKVMVREQIIRHKSDGHPATLIPKLVEGQKLVAELKFKYDIATEVHKACIESIKDVRNKIDTYRSLLSFLKAEMTGN